MRGQDPSSWIWGDALSLLEQAERLHRQFARASVAEQPCWEPPIDVVEDDETVLVLVALPGVPAGKVAVGFDPGGVTVSGLREFPGIGAARIRRIEIPYGRFRRRIALPMHTLEPASQELADGCLLLTFTKARRSR